MKPVFIGGCPRSGTTMLASMLGMHSRMLTVPESHFKTDFLHGLDGQFSRDSIPESLSLIRSNLTFKSWGLDAVIAQACVEDFDGSYGQFVEYFVAQYGEHNGGSNFDYWVDHTPSNINYAHFLLTQWPDSKMLHIVRDGRAVAASVLPLDWGPFTMKHAAERWRLDLAAGLATELAFTSNRVLRVRYERILREPHRVLSEICGFIGVECEERMELGQGFDVPAASKQQHTLVGSLPNPERIDAWRKRLTSRQIELFEFYAGDMLKLTGYDMECGIIAPSPSSLENLRMTVADIVTPYLKKPRYLIRHSESTVSTLLRKAKGLVSHLSQRQ